MSILFQKEVPEKGKFDLIVAGGGVAGAAAALAGVRAGKTVLLIEKSTMLGGLATLGLINYFVPMCNGRGKAICKGIAEEFLRLSIKHGYDSLPEEWKDGEPAKPTNVRYVTRYSASIFALELTGLLKRAGVELLFDTVVVEPVMEGKLCKGLVVENKSGLEFYAAKMVIDTTGDADILYRAGVPTVQGRNFHTYAAHGATLETCKKAYDEKDIGKMYGGFDASGGHASLYGDNHPENMAYYTGTSSEDVNTYFVRNQLEFLDKLDETKRKEREVTMLPGMAQFRTTRHIDADYTLTMKDVYKHFDDSVSAINDFDRRDFLFEIPYRSMIRSEFPNLITAGRTVAGEEYAWDILRVIPPAILSGQAAGNAASLAIEEGKGLGEIDVKELQKRLAGQNVMIHFDDEWINWDADPGRVDENGHF